MIIDVSAAGTTIVLKASVTYPAGIALSCFATDQAPWDVPDVQIAGVEPSLNGDLAKHCEYHEIPLSFSLIPNSVDDEAMKVLWKRNRPGRGRAAAMDDITLVISNPTWTVPVRTLSGGTMLSGPAFPGAGGNQSLESQRYQFAFAEA